MTALAYDLALPSLLRPALPSTPNGTGAPAAAPTLPGVVDVSSRPIWLAFQYAIPSGASAERTAIWRDLQDLRALNLQPGVWAIGRHEHDRDRLADLIQRAHRSGGSATARTVGFDTRDDVVLQSKLSRACEHLWDDFFNHSDWYAATSLDPTVTPAARIGELDALRREFASMRVRDLVVSEASQRASAQLDQYAARLMASTPPGGSPEEDQRPTHPRVDITASWRLRAGSTTFVAETVPAAGLRWEQDLRAFEALVYRPDPGRVELHHGVFTWSGPPDSAAATVVAIDKRLACFAASYP